MKILITGAAGFIGSHLAKYCEDQGHRVNRVDNNWDNNSEHWAHSCDVSKWHEISYVFNYCKPDVCFHLAAYASEGRSNHIRSFIHKNNTVGTANVINACVNHNCKLVFTSSVAVYSGSPPFTETMTPRPIDEYGLSKYMSERSIQIAGDTQGLDYCIIRPRNVYGPGQNMWDRSRNLFGIWMYNALHDLPLTIFGEGSNMRTFTYIDDIIPALYRAKDISSEVINLGSERAYTIHQAAVEFCLVSGLDYKKSVVHTEERHEVQQAYCNITKSINLLHFMDRTLIDVGLKKMWDWAKAQPERPLQSMPPLEVTINAHSSLKA